MERKYESMIIIRPDLAEKEFQEIFDKITKKIDSLGGKTLETKVWAKDREFCYPIRSRGAEKKKFNKGLFWLIEFILDTEKLPQLKETIRLEERILRNIIIRRG